MSTFIGQLIGFAVIVYIVWRYVVPPVRKMMANRQEAVRKQLEDNASATKRLVEATQAHKKALREADGEAKGKATPDDEATVRPKSKGKQKSKSKKTKKTRSSRPPRDTARAREGTRASGDRSSAVAEGVEQCHQLGGPVGDCRSLTLDGGLVTARDRPGEGVRRPQHRPVLE